MPDILRDIENSMIDTKVSAFRELSVVWGDEEVNKHWETALIYQMSQSLGIAKGVNCSRAESGIEAPWLPVFSKETSGKLEWESR